MRKGILFLVAIACSSTPPDEAPADGAVLEYASVSVTRSGSGSGLVTSQPDAVYCGSTCSVLFRIGRTVTLSASADLGSVFDGWSGPCEGTARCVFEQRGDTNVVARFRRTAPGTGHAVTVVTSPGGVVASSPTGIYCGALCVATFDEGAEVTLTALAENGGAFTGWSGACSGTAQNCTLTVDGPKQVEANFGPTLTVVPRRIGRNASDPGGTGTVTSDPAGINCGPACTAAFPHDVVVTLTARADLGTIFSGWLGACAPPACTCTGTRSPCTIAIDESHRLTAQFTRTGLAWERRFGFPGSAWGASAASDPSGAAVISGTFSNTIDFGGGLLRSNGAEDAFIAKFSSSGATIWSKSFGSDGGAIPYNYYCPTYPYGYYNYYYYPYYYSTQHPPCESAWRVVVDSTGAVVVAGEFIGEMNIGGAPSDALISARGPAAQGGAPTFDIFVAKFSSAGQHVWSRRYGGSNVDTAQGLAVDREGNVVITGGFYSPTIDFGGGELRNGSNGWAPYVAKISKDGAPLWSKQFSVDASGGSGWSRDVAIDGAGNIFVVGTFSYGIDLGGGRLTPIGTYYYSDGFIAKYSATGAHLWSKQIGGGSNDHTVSVAVGENGHPVVGGSFVHWADLGGGTVVAPWNRSHIFLVQYAGPDGTLQWAKNIGAPATEAASTQNLGGLAVDRQNNLILSGVFWGTVDFGGKLLESTSAYSYPPDFFLAKYGSDGSLKWAQRFKQGPFAPPHNYYAWGWLASVATGPSDEIWALADIFYPVDFGAGPNAGPSTDSPNVVLLKFAP
ncbi:MAG: SBBP repeat-containing protein [Deltaproteobacteria bacterium]|nr:SBBP repeat-containing protein [Deltaproteobacteria bacterium]